MQPTKSSRHNGLRRSLALASVVLAVCAAASPGCGNSGLVGGKCLQGLTNCSNVCVNLQIDQYNCGHCGHVCQSGVACINGQCGAGELGGAGFGGAGGDGNHYPDGSAGTGLTSSDAQGDEGNPQAGGSSIDVASRGGAAGSHAGGGSSIDFASGGAAGSDLGGGSSIDASNGGTAGNDAGLVDACTPPYNNPQHCGDCTTVCTADLPVCAPSAGSYECRPMCDPPLVNCNGTCVDLNSDPSNCGICNKDCPSGACQAGACVGVQTGDFVAICMNYRALAGTQTTILLGKAMFLPAVATVRILAYDQYADAAAAQQVDATLKVAATQYLGRQFTMTRVSNSTDVRTLLTKSNYDAFLVYEQPNAPPGELSTIGSLWASPLASFTYVGGTIVVLDGGQGVREMTQLLTSTRLFPVNDEVGISASTYLYRPASTDALATGLTTQFPCQNDTCAFETPVTPDATTSFVVTEPLNDAGLERPVVVHTTRIAPQ